MPEWMLAFTGAGAASPEQVATAFSQQFGLRVEVKKADGHPTADFLVTFASKDEWQRAQDLIVQVAGQQLRPTLWINRPHLHWRPYAHVKVPERSSELSVTWHDGAVRGRISGELRCTLTVLTPLLAGNEQYRVGEARGAKPIGDGGQCRVPWFDRPVSANRIVLEPLRDTQRRVLIAGEQIKGMVRQSIGALLGAPMERVKEQSFSYRPNLKWPSGKLILEPRPAIVTRVKVFNDYQVPDEIDVYPMERPQFNKGKTYNCRYRGGMEGWEKGFHGSPELTTRSLHTSAQTNSAKPDQKSFRIDDSVHDLWVMTHQHLIDDEGGHVSSRHPSIHDDAGRRRAVENLQRATAHGFAPGDLIFVEWDVGNRGVVSYGHHYYYRWRYLNTVRQRRDAYGHWAERPEVSSRIAEEEKDSNGRPFTLTGARAIFGYSGDNDGSRHIGSGDFTQLAGRVSFNMAVEETPAGVPEDQRFLAPETGFAVPLKELATPKPSAVEFYIDQSRLGERQQRDRGVVVTYGDLPDWDPPGDLAGRKFYRHNPKAAQDSGEYTAQTSADLLNERATIARFVSRPGIRFRFKVRFRDLSREELGTLMLALCPDQFVKYLPEPVLTESKVRTDGTAERPRYAVKLGHARPLGWGSVYITVDAAYGLTNGDGGWQLNQLADNSLSGCVQAAAVCLDTRSLREWLEIHDYCDSRWDHYPVGRDGRIFSFHAQIRQKHSEGRRRKA